MPNVYMHMLCQSLFALFTRVRPGRAYPPRAVLPHVFLNFRTNDSKARSVKADSSVLRDISGSKVRPMSMKLGTVSASRPFDNLGIERLLALLVPAEAPRREACSTRSAMICHDGISVIYTCLCFDCFVYRHVDTRGGYTVYTYTM